ncbi:MAG: SRPBCC domain-containing protein [Nitrososphaeraceae archaeon]
MSAKEMEGQQKQEITEIRKSIIIDATPEVVFKAITETNELTKWFPDHVILEPNVGGKVRFSFYKEQNKMDRDYIVEGSIIEFIPNKKISYTWQYKDIPEFSETIVSWELEELERNKTRVELVHSGFTGKEQEKVSSKGHDEGWTHFMNELSKYCLQRK